MRGNYIIIDFETGGVDCNKNPVTQVAMLALSCSNLKELGRYETFVKPYADLILDPKALEKTQVSDADLMNGKDFAVVVSDMMSFAKEHKLARNSPIWVGHNCGFDIAFGNVLFNFAKKDLTKTFDSNNGEITRIDTLQIARMVWGVGLKDGDNSSFKLTDCCERAGIKLYDAHGAMNDVIATTQLFKYFCSLSSTSKVEDEGTEKSRKFYSF